MAKTTRFSMPESKKVAPKGAKALGRVDPDELIEVIVRVRRRATPPAGERRGYLSYDEFREQRGADPADLAKVEAFANEHGLSVTMSSRAQRAVHLIGAASAMQEAFSVSLTEYRVGKVRFRGRQGQVTVPMELKDVIEGVFGLDDRPAHTPHFHVASTKGKMSPRATGGGSFTPPQVAKLYGFPANATGHGQTVAILEFGGGYRLSELKKYFLGIGVKPPALSAVSVLGAHNTPTSNPNGPDGEVMLDLEVAGSVAPGAKIVVYFAPNTDAGFQAALYAAVHDSLRKPSVVSLSWGSPELNSTAQSRKDFDSACQDAAALGITVCVSAGDHGSADTDPPTSRVNVDFPASSPNVLACGGTHLEAKNGAISAETVWNNHNGWATGGGVSETFSRPSYQSDVNVPKAAIANGKVGRGVPDVSGNADGNTGYQILVDGKSIVVGGTSAVAPLWAALVALLAESSGTRLGLINPVIYRQASAGFRDITQGDNGAYRAGPGWDPCTGLGSPSGAELLQAFASVRR